MLFEEPEYCDIVKTTIACHWRDVNSKHDWEDCFQEVYLIALMNENLKDHPNIKSWLHLTAKNVAKDLRRQSNRHNRRTALFGAAETIADDDNFVREIETKVIHRELLIELKETLSESDYRLFEMKYIEKRTSKEIGEILGIKPSSVDMKRCRLQKKLKEISKKYK
jgi:RNA polymerase sigma-70 factor (ECF subfamily)